MTPSPTLTAVLIALGITGPVEITVALAQRRAANKKRREQKWQPPQEAVKPNRH